MVGKLRREMKQSISLQNYEGAGPGGVESEERRGELIMRRVIEELKGITPVRFYGEDIA
jgi:hypothetical protein